MKNLSGMIRALRREIELGLGGDDAGTRAVRADPERVTVTLALAGALDDSESAWQLANPAAGVTTAHSIRIEFRIGPAGVLSTTESAAVSNGQSPSAAALAAGAIAQVCEGVFGAPGFDNAARAEVFCELMDQYPVVALLASLTVLSGESTKETVPAALVGRLSQLLGFAPAGREAAAGAMRRLLAKSPASEVRGVIAERWRFGTHWGASA